MDRVSPRFGAILKVVSECWFDLPMEHFEWAVKALYVLHSQEAEAIASAFADKNMKVRIQGVEIATHLAILTTARAIDEALATVH